MEENLRAKTFFSIIWSYIGKFGSQAIAIIPAMILARLLGPSQYGLIAMAGVFTGIAYQLADAGFGNALIQKKDADNIDYSTVFFFNIGICGFIYLIIFFCATPISEFFHEPRLVAIVRVSSLGIIIIAFGQIQTLIFKKNLNYKSQVLRNLSCQILSVIIAIVLAYKGFGVWALVIQGLTSTAGTVIINWFISTWRPTAVFSLNRLKRLFNFGSKTLASSLIDYGFNKAYEVVIGRVYNPASLGLYNRAFSTADIFKSSFFSVFSGVTFPVFVRMQDDNERLVTNIRKFLQIITLIVFSGMGTVIILGHPIFLFMYSTKWDAAVNLFGVACCIAMVTPIVSILESIILAKGYSGRFLMVSIIRKFFVVAVIGCVWQFGVMWLMVGQLIVSICECTIYTFVTRQIVGYSIGYLMHDIFPSLLVGLGVCSIALGANQILLWLTPSVDHTDMMFLLTQIIIGIAIAIIAFVAICKLTRCRAYIELLQFIEDSVGPKKILTYLKCKA